MSKATMIDLLTSLSKQRGFIFQSSEIYGGLGSTWDYGPLGIELKRNIKSHWWKSMITKRQNVVGMDASILMHPDVWRASGHIDNFHDPLVDNKDNKKRYRLDHLLEDQPDSVIDYLSMVGDNNTYGARPIKRKIQTQIENELSKLIISDDIVKGGPIFIDSLPV